MADACPFVDRPPMPGDYAAAHGMDLPESAYFDVAIGERLRWQWGYIWGWLRLLTPYDLHDCAEYLLCLWEARRHDRARQRRREHGLIDYQRTREVLRKSRVQEVTP